METLSRNETKCRAAKTDEVGLSDYPRIETDETGCFPPPSEELVTV